MKNYEFRFKTTQQELELYGQSWLPANPQAYMLLIHGLGDHSDRYQEVATELAKKQIATFSFDLEGHGHSMGKRGYSSSFENFISQASDFLNYIQSEHKIEAPLFLFGHSMGGLIATHLYARQSDSFDGLILSSPALALTVKPSSLKLKLAEFSAKHFPKLTLWNEVREEWLVKDPSLIDKFQKDPLHHDQISATVYLGMLKFIDELNHFIKDLQGPILMQIAGRDKIVDANQIELLFHKIRSQNKEFLTYPNALHEIYFDQEKKQALEALQLFIKMHSKGKS